MNAPETLLRDSLYLAETHEVVNVSRELVDYNPYAQDTALVDGGGARGRRLGARRRWPPSAG